MQLSRGTTRNAVVSGHVVYRDQGAAIDVSTSFDDFVRDQRTALVRYAVLLSGSQTQGEDLVQEVLIRIYPRWASLVGAEGSVHAYVRRAITNEFLSWRRRWSTRHIRLAQRGQVEPEPVDPWADDHDDELWQCLARLPDRQRVAVTLRFYEGLDDAEIAEAMGCREGTVRSHISRGLANLRSALLTPRGLRRTHA